MYKHYVKLDENNFIIHGFSSAFQKPEESDICINESAGRHFNLIIRDAHGRPFLKWDGTDIKNVDLPEPSVEKDEVEKLRELVADLIAYVLGE